MKYHVVVGRLVGLPLVEADIEDLDLVVDGIIRPWKAEQVFHCEGRKIDPKEVTWVRVFRSADSLSALKRATATSKMEFMLSPHSFLSDVADEIPITKLIMILKQGNGNSIAKGGAQRLQEFRSEFAHVSFESLIQKRDKFQEFKDAHQDQISALPSLANEAAVEKKFWDLLREDADFSLLEARWIGKWFLDDQDEVYGWIEKAFRYTVGADWTEAARKFVELFVDPYLSFLEDHMGQTRAISEPAANITISGVSGGMIQILQGNGTATQHGSMTADAGKEIANLLRELRNLIGAAATADAFDKDSTLEIVETAIEETDKPEPRTSRVKALLAAVPDWVKTLDPYVALVNTLASLPGRIPGH